MVASDLDMVMELEQASFPSPWSRELYEHELFRNPYSHYRVVVPAVELPEEAALPSLFAQAGYMLFSEEAHILTIAVQPLWRGHGIGAWLLLRVCAEARETGVQAMTLEVRPSNQAALHLYRTLGFHQVGRRRRYYPDKEDALVLALTGIQAPRIWTPLQERLAELDACMAKGIPVT
ncbi:MAG: ribosomal-protein-alanine N-acetyltransferase [Caldilineae bacterium]|nr:MAG: ribosomal-protein-alanine N-acetyltransferase [Caldilineae bacterium]